MSYTDSQNIQYKASTGQVNLDQAQGIVECFVAGIGNKDSVGDVCATGAFAKSLLRRKPRVVWGHNWNDPIGKVLEMYEVPPNDPRLPAKMRSAGIGGLYAKVQFNLNSEKGKEAFANVAFFGEEQEWSIGYKTLRAQFDQGSQANILYEVELYEVSPVLHGANQLTGTISVKNAEGNTPMVMPAMQGMPNIPEDEVQRKLQEELSLQTGSKVNISSVEDGEVTFTMGEKGEEESYKCHFRNDNGVFMFSNPQRINKPMQMPGQMQPMMPMGMPSRPMVPQNPNQTVVVPQVLPGGMPNQMPLVQIDYVGEDSSSKPQGKPKLVQEEADLAEALIKITKRHGKFNEDANGVWAGYKPAAENMVAKIGVKCSNCVMYEGNGVCKIIALKVEDGGKCRFAVIPEGVVKVSPIKKQEVTEEMQEEEVKWLKEIEDKYPEVFIKGDLRHAVKSKRDALTASVKLTRIEEYSVKSASNEIYYLPVAQKDAFEMKQAIDPIIDYYRAEAYVDDGGIVFTSGVNKDFAEAVNNAVKALGRNLAGRTARAGRGMAARFNPKAWDGDNDGLVQEGTPYQRPAIPGINDFGTRGVVDAARATAAFNNAPRDPESDRSRDRRKKPEREPGKDRKKPTPDRRGLSSGKRDLSRHSNRDRDLEKQFPNAEENAKREAHDKLIDAWEAGMDMGFTTIGRQRDEVGGRFSEDFLRGRELGYNDARSRWYGKGTAEQPKDFDPKAKASGKYSSWYRDVVSQLGRGKANRPEDADREQQYAGIDAGMKEFLMSVAPDTSNWAEEDRASLAKLENDYGFGRGGLSSGKRRGPLTEDEKTSQGQILDYIKDIYQYDREFGSDQRLREMAKIVHDRWKKATPQEREDYISGYGNATGGAFDLAAQEELLDGFSPPEDRFGRGGLSSGMGFDKFGNIPAKPKNNRRTVDPSLRNTSKNRAMMTAERRLEEMANSGDAEYDSIMLRAREALSNEGVPGYKLTNEYGEPNSLVAQKMQEILAADIQRGALSSGKKPGVRDRLDEAILEGKLPKSEWTKTQNGFEMDAPDIDGMYQINNEGNGKYSITRFSDMYRNGGQNALDEDIDKTFNSPSAAKKWAEKDYNKIIENMSGPEDYVGGSSSLSSGRTRDSYGNTRTVEEERAIAAYDEAWNPSSPNELDKISRSDDVQTRINVASNSQAFGETLRRLLKDENLEVRKAADKNIQKRLNDMANEPGIERRNPRLRARKEFARKLLAEHEEEMKKAGMRPGGSLSSGEKSWVDLAEEEAGNSPKALADFLIDRGVLEEDHPTIEKLRNNRTNDAEYEKAFEMLAEMDAEQGGLSSGRRDLGKPFSSYEELSNNERSAIEQAYFADNLNSERPGSRDYDPQIAQDDFEINPEKYGYSPNFRGDAVRELRKTGISRDDAESITDYWIENDGIHKRYLKKANGDTLAAMNSAYDDYLDSPYARDIRESFDRQFGFPEFPSTRRSLSSGRNRELTDQQVTNIKKRLAALEAALESGDEEAQKELLKKIFKGKSYSEPFIGEQFGRRVLDTRPKTLGRDGNSPDAPDKEITDEDLKNFIKSKFESDAYDYIASSIDPEEISYEDGLSSDQIEDSLPYISGYDRAIEKLEEENINETSYNTPSTIEEIADILGSEELLLNEVQQQIFTRKQKLENNDKARGGLSSGRGIDPRQGDPEEVGRSLERLSQRSDDLGANFRYMRDLGEEEFVQFEYRGKMREVRPDPSSGKSLFQNMKMSKDGALYFVGIDSESGEVRSFRLDRINGLILGADYGGYDSGWDGLGFNDELPRALTGLGSGRRGMSSGRGNGPTQHEMRWVRSDKEDGYEQYNFADYAVRVYDDGRLESLYDAPMTNWEKIDTSLEEWQKDINEKFPPKQYPDRESLIDDTVRAYLRQEYDSSQYEDRGLGRKDRSFTNLLQQTSFTEEEKQKIVEKTPDTSYGDDVERDRNNVRKALGLLKPSTVKVPGLSSGRRGMSSGRYGEKYDPSKRDPSDYAQLNGKPHRPRWDGKSGKWVYDTPDDGTSKTRPHNWDTPDTPAEDHDAFWRDYVRIPYQELLAEYPIVAGEKSPAISGRVQRLAAARRFRMGLPFDGKLKAKRIRQFGQMSEDEREYEKQLIAEAIAKDFSHSGLSVDELAYRFNATPLQIHDVLDSVAELVPETFDGDRRATDIPSPSREVQRLRRERIELAQEYDTALKTNEDILSRRSDLIAEHPSTKRMKNVQSLRLAKQRLRLAGVSFETADKDLEALRSEDNKIVNAKLKEIYDVDDEDLASTAREIFEENLSEDFDEDGEYIGPRGDLYDAEDAKQDLIKDWDLINVLVESGQAKDDKDAENILSGLVFNDVATLVPDEDVIRLMAFNEAKQVEDALNRYKEVSSRLKANDPALNASEKENINEIHALEAEAINAVNAVLQDVDVPEKPRTPSSARGLSSGRSRRDGDGVDVGTVAGSVYSSTATRGMSSGLKFEPIGDAHERIDPNNESSLRKAAIEAKAGLPEVEEEFSGEQLYSYVRRNSENRAPYRDEIRNYQLAKLEHALKVREEIVKAVYEKNPDVQRQINAMDVYDFDENNGGPLRSETVDSLADLDDFIQKIRDEVEMFEDRYDRKSQDLEDARELIPDTYREIQSAKLELEVARMDLDEGDIELDKYTKLVKEINSRVDELNKQLDEYRSNRDDLAEEVSEASFFGDGKMSTQVNDMVANYMNFSSAGNPRSARRTGLASGRREMMQDTIAADETNAVRESLLDADMKETDRMYSSFMSRPSSERASAFASYRRETGKSPNPNDPSFRRWIAGLESDLIMREDSGEMSGRDSGRGLSSGSKRKKG